MRKFSNLLIFFCLLAKIQIKSQFSQESNVEMANKEKKCACRVKKWQKEVVFP